MMRTSHISNKLRILEGNIVVVPGNEPISAATNISSYQYNPYVETIFNCDYCHNSYITLHKAMEVIPDATIIWSSDPSMRFFALPAGPAPDGNQCPCNIIIDYYDILRKNADSLIQEDERKPTIDEICSGFSYDFCGR